MLLWAECPLHTQRSIYKAFHLNSLSVTETVAALCCFDIDYLTTLLFVPSCVSHPDGVSRRHNGEVWNLGHRRSRALPQFGTYVLQRSAGRHRGLRHHKRGTLARVVTRRVSKLLGTDLVVCLQESFARAKNWVKELQRQASPNIVIALSGNKADLASKRAVDFQVSANGLHVGSDFCTEILYKYLFK